MYLIKREKNHDGNIPSFAYIDPAMKWIENNTGMFNNNEVIAIINYDEGICRFVRMEVTVVAKLLEKS